MQVAHQSSTGKSYISNSLWWYWNVQGLFSFADAFSNARINPETLIALASFSSRKPNLAICVRNSIICFYCKREVGNYCIWKPVNSTKTLQIHEICCLAEESAEHQRYICAAFQYGKFPTLKIDKPKNSSSMKSSKNQAKNNFLFSSSDNTPKRTANI